MKGIRIVSIIIGISQLVLGTAFMFFLEPFFAANGFGVPSGASAYMFSHLAARFYVYGIGMFFIAHNPVENRLWLDGMIAIQILDLIGGVWHVTTGDVTLRQAMFPMFKRNSLYSAYAGFQTAR
jgi:hypothetical protein